MILTKLLAAVAIVTTLGFLSCAPKDADIKASIEEKLKAMPEMISDVTVDVKDGVQALAASAKMINASLPLKKAATEVKGVKSVINNSTVAAPPPPPTPPPASMTTVLERSYPTKSEGWFKKISQALRRICSR
jgi:hypothetical protein